MLAKRIIPCLDIKNNRVVKGCRFKLLRDCGDPVALAMKYCEEGADELIFLDITASLESRGPIMSLIEKIAKQLSIPFAVGGGIRNLEDAKTIIEAGADKVIINSAAILRPEFITELAQSYGSQSIVVAIDAATVNSKCCVFSHAGSINTGRDLISWGQEAVARGAGEVVFTSIDHDGTKSGYACKLSAQLSTSISVPLIASGGAGTADDLLEVFTHGKCEGAIGASIFHDNILSIAQVKNYLMQNEVRVRL